MHIKPDWKSYRYLVFFNSYQGRTDFMFKNIFISGNYEREKKSLDHIESVFPKKIPRFFNRSRLRKVKWLKPTSKLKLVRNL